MYPDAALAKKTGIVIAVVAAVGIAIALLLWFRAGQGPGALGWNVPLLALAVFQWLRGEEFEALRARGCAGVASVTGYPGFGEVAIRVVPDDGSAPFNAIIAGGTSNWPELGSTHRAYFRQAAPRTASVVLGERIPLAAAASQAAERQRLCVASERSLSA